MRWSHDQSSKIKSPPGRSRGKSISNVAVLGTSKWLASSTTKSNGLAPNACSRISGTVVLFRLVDTPVDIDSIFWVVCRQKFCHSLDRFAGELYCDQPFRLQQLPKKCGATSLINTNLDHTAATKFIRDSQISVGKLATLTKANPLAIRRGSMPWSKLEGGTFNNLKIGDVFSSVKV